MFSGIFGGIKLSLEASDASLHSEQVHSRHSPHHALCHHLHPSEVNIATDFELMRSQSNRHHTATNAHMLLHPPLFRAVLLCRSATVTRRLLSSTQSALPGCSPCVHVKRACVCLYVCVCVCVCVCLHSVGTTFHQMRTRHAGWPGKISWHSSHLAYWPEHIHEDIISSADSLLPRSLAPSLRLLSVCPSSLCASPTTCIQQKHRSEETLGLKGTCGIHLRRNIVYSAHCLISESACVEAAAAAAPDSRSPNKLFSFCVQLQNSLFFLFFFFFFLQPTKKKKKKKKIKH